MEDVARIVLPFERSEPGQLVGRIGATYAALPFVTKDVDIDAACERLHHRTEPPSGLHALLILGRVRPRRCSDELHQGVAMAKGTVVVRRRGDCAAVTLE